mmetsp:Transcript_10953/g.16135  ORF Transcript_10953/g.16135 Transcript_10953/m.16135 type:complete len:283 (-) Transcript_10953:130-978(-)|eukprot:CAMPEP_0194217834 /NCGR_PEP_ID=MMETSP0156-20130528/22348_1 /TAXON_ID=33649 /ORGANISM="Thalassionema nitzschioides, Strain L26-B" /LENGTH=282 /DNA_ID=CAMNT_0038946977 /DNA_START=43 /DNA_END=891 /DNA_ORIENTATION=-
MSTSEPYYWKASDGIEMYGHKWGVDEPRAVVILVHGMNEHCLRFDHVAKEFNQSGFTVYGFDHRGHGRTKGKRGHTPSYDKLLESVKDTIDRAKAENNAKPIFLYGHSMGGNVVLNYALQRKPDKDTIAGIMSSSAWLALPSGPPAILNFLAKFLRCIWPSFTQKSTLDPEAMSRDPEVIKKYKSDSLVHDRISVEFFLGCREAADFALANAGDFGYPLWIAHGTEDKLTSHDASKEFSGKVPNAAWKSWEGFYHELHNEPEKKQVIDSMIDFMNSLLEENA